MLGTPVSQKLTVVNITCSRKTQTVENIRPQLYRVYSSIFFTHFGYLRTGFSTTISRCFTAFYNTYVSLFFSTSTLRVSIHSFVSTSRGLPTVFLLAFSFLQRFIKKHFLWTYTLHPIHTWNINRS
jgi:hypothetical protein